MMDKTTEQVSSFEMIGYTHSEEEPNIITSAVMQDQNSGLRFIASMYEVFKMVQDGTLVLPEGLAK